MSIKNYIFDFYKIIANLLLYLLVNFYLISYKFTNKISINNIKFPDSIKRIQFGYYFNQSIENIKFPDSVKSIQFGLCFNQPIENVK
jgi:hypothetical protein